MPQLGRTFSESWHRVGLLRLALRPTVTVSKQVFRGETWYLLHDPFNNGFFRVRPEAYAFIARLRPDRTVEDVWEKCLALNPEMAPGQEDAIALMAQLHRANLLYYRGTADAAKVFDRYEERRQRELAGWFMNVMMPRFHLWDPDTFLDRMGFFVRHLTGAGAVLIWLIVVGLAAQLAVERAHLLWVQSEGILAPGNWGLMYLAVIVVKALHELGHAVLCKRFGGEVHTMGISVLVFTPLPYVDATSSWGLRSRWQRAIIGAGGMIAELFVAGVATIVWARTGHGTAHAMAFNVMWIASVSTLLFNINPLVRFDGYYICADLLDLPNLQTRALEQLQYLAEHYILASHAAETPSQSTAEAAWLTGYGLLSGAYRVVLAGGIIFFVADKFLLVGVLLALACVISWVLVPLWSLVTYLGTSPRLARRRGRAVAIVVGGLSGIVVLLGLVPAPNRFRAPGVVEPVHQMEVAAEAPGVVDRVLARSGSFVTTGTPLVELRNPEIALDVADVAAQLDELAATQAGLESRSKADVEPLLQRIGVVKGRLATLRQQQDALTIRARLTGRWIAPEISGSTGLWLSRGAVVGKIVNNARFRFRAVVPQDEASSVFVQRIAGAQVRLVGESSTTIAVGDFHVIPFQQGRLPSRALGWRGGGEIAVALDDASGLQSAEPFFEIDASLQESPGVVLLPGRSGRLGLTLTPEPLLWQWGRKLRQLIQRRYHA